MTCTKDTSRPVPEEVMKALSASYSVFVLRQMRMPLPPGVNGDALTLIGDEQHRRWKADETLLTQEEINIIHKHFKDAAMTKLAEAFVKVVTENVERWNSGLTPLTKAEQREILGGCVGNKQQKELRND